MPGREEVLERARQIGELVGPPIPYFRSDIKTFESKLWLRVGVSQEKYYLPIVNIRTRDNPLGIAYVDSHPYRNPRLAASMAEGMAHIIAARAPKIVIMPGSSKSEIPIQEAVTRASKLLSLGENIPIVRLPTSTIKEDVHSQTDGGYTMSYHPVTLRDGEIKYIGVAQTDSELIRQTCPNGLDLLIVDDVGTTFATIHAAEKLLDLGESSVHHISVFAREAPEGDPAIPYPPFLPPRVHAGVFLPELVFPAQEADSLFMPDNIPPVR